jgi:hypothetical protein
MYLPCLFLLLLPLQLQQPSYLAGILLTFRQLAAGNDKLTELMLPLLLLLQLTELLPHL